MRPFLIKYNQIFFILFLSYGLSQNFLYSEEDWFVVTSPKEINSISYVYDEILFSSSNGIFEYNKLTDSFFYRHDLISEFLDNDFHIIHYDKYRDQIWLVTDEYILFKSYNSKIWRRISFHELNLTSSMNIYNIGSNQDYIFIELPMNVIALNPYNGYLINDDEYNYDPYAINQITWSASYKSSLAPFNDLTNFFSLNDWNILGPTKLENKGRIINILCSIKDPSGNTWFGSDSGEIFLGNSHSRNFTILESVPLVNNLNVAYMDENNEWWIADNDWLYSSSRFKYEQELIFMCNWNEKNNKWIPYYQNEYSYIESRDINCIYKVNNWLYIGTDYGLLVYDLLDDKWTLFNDNNGLANNIFSIEYYSNNLYLGSNNGIYEFSTMINKPIKKINYENYQVYDMDLLDDQLYVVSNIGFFCINLSLYNIELLLDDEFKEIEIHNNDIYLMHRNKLMHYTDNKLKKINRFMNPKGMDVCNDYIWVYNSVKASIFSTKSDFYLEYDNLDGIVGNKINSIECDNDWVWFVTNNGLSFYNWSKYHND